MGLNTRLRSGSSLLLSSLLIMVFILSLGGLGFFALQHVRGELNEVDRQRELAGIAQEVHAELLREAGAMREYFLSGDERHLARAQEARTRLTGWLDDLAELATAESTRTRIEQMRKDLDKYHAAAGALPTRAGLQADASAWRDELAPALETISAHSAELVSELQRDAANRVTAAEGRAAQLQLALLVLLAIGLLGILIVSLLTARTTKTGMQRLANAARQIAAGNLVTERLEAGTGGAVGDIARAMGEMTANLRELLQQISQGVETVMDASEQLSAASDAAAQAATSSAQAITQVAAGSSEQARGTAEARALMDQLRDSIRQIAEGAGQTAESVQSADTLVKQMAASLEEMATTATGTADRGIKAVERTQAGVDVVARTLSELEEIGDMVEAAAERIKQLDHISGQIGAITEAISGIADQTNLLALNAAIEAARAGAHGRGFAVVAEEVRKLAEQSAASAREIADLIARVQSGTAEAVRAMDAGTERVRASNKLAAQASHALNDILTTLKTAVQLMGGVAEAAEKVRSDSGKVIRTFDEVAALIEESTAATEEMAASAAEVTTIVHNIAEVSGENAAAAQEVSAAVEELTASSEQVATSARSLAEMAKELRQELQRFTF